MPKDTTETTLIREFCTGGGLANAGQRLVRIRVLEPDEKELPVGAEIAPSGAEPHDWNPVEEPA